MKSCPIATQGRDVQKRTAIEQREKGRHHSEKEGTHKHNDEANNRALAPKLGPGDAKPLAPWTPEATGQSRGYRQPIRHPRKGRGMPSPLP